MNDFDFDHEFWTEFIPYNEIVFKDKMKAERAAIEISKEDYWGESKIRVQKDEGFCQGRIWHSCWTDHKIAIADKDGVSDYYFVD